MIGEDIENLASFAKSMAAQAEEIAQPLAELQGWIENYAKVLAAWNKELGPLFQRLHCELAAIAERVAALEAAIVSPGARFDPDSAAGNVVELKGRRS